MEPEAISPKLLQRNGQGMLAQSKNHGVIDCPMQGDALMHVKLHVSNNFWMKNKSPHCYRPQMLQKVVI